jgi:hypothetical protein
MNDDEFVAAFEAGSIAPDAFRHRDHVRLTWLYLVRYGTAETERRLLSGLNAFAVRAGKPEKFDAPLTRAWVAAIDTARGPHASFDDMIAARPDLLNPRTVPDRRPAKASGRSCEDE